MLLNAGTVVAMPFCTTRLLSIVLVIPALVSACGNASPANRTSTTSEVSSPATAPDESRLPLAMDDTAEALHARVLVRDRNRDQAGRENCLLRVQQDQVFLDADLASAVRPPPPLLADSLDRISRTRELAILSRFGGIGNAQDSNAMVIVAWTSLSSSEKTWILAVDGQRGTLRGVGEFNNARAEHLRPEALSNSLRPPEGERLVLMVVPTLQTSMRDLVQWLSAVPRHVRVGLGSLLPAGTNFQGEALQAYEHCESGVPASAGILTDDNFGELSDRERTDLVAQLRAVGERCASNVGSLAGNAATMRLSVHLRPNGEVASSCQHESDRHDVWLDTCLREGIAAVRYAPREGNTSHILVSLPLTVRGEDVPEQRPICR